MTIQNDPNGKVMLAKTSHLIEAEFDEVNISFMVNDSFIHMESHAMEVPIIEVYAPGCDPEYPGDGITEATVPNICILCEDVAYEACESFKETGAVPDAIEFRAVNGIFKFCAKLPYYDDLIVYMYGFDMADGAWENAALCVIYPKEYADTDDEKRLMAVLDAAAASYKETR